MPSGPSKRYALSILTIGRLRRAALSLSRAWVASFSLVQQFRARNEPLVSRDDVRIGHGVLLQCDRGLFCFAVAHWRLGAHAQTASNYNVPVVVSKNFSYLALFALQESGNTLPTAL